MSKLNDILNAVVADHVAAALSIAGNALTIVKRKLPKKEDPLDSPYQVTISPSEVAETATRIAFGNIFKVVYHVEMTLVVPNDRDQLINLDQIAEWRELTRARYMKPTPIAVTGVKRVELVEGVFLDRTVLLTGYDYDQIVIDIWTYEDRT